MSPEGASAAARQGGASDGTMIDDAAGAHSQAAVAAPTMSGMNLLF